MAPTSWYRAHPEIAIPAWLQGQGWEDASWGNDACGSSEHALPDGRVLRVWVDHKDPARREMRGRFSLVIFPDRDSVGDVALATVVAEGIESESEASHLVWQLLGGG